MLKRKMFHIISAKRPENLAEKEQTEISYDFLSQAF